MRTPLLLSSLIALGALPPLPEPRTQEDLDREDAARRERVRADLVTRGIDPEEVRAAVGSGRFVEVGRAVLAVAKHHAEQFGMQPPLSELLGIVADLEAAHLRLRDSLRNLPEQKVGKVAYAVVGPAREQSMVGKTALADPDHVERGGAYAREVATREAHWARVAPVLLAARVACAGLDTVPEVAAARGSRPERNRQAQRAARKVRKAAKARRGW